MQKVSASTSQEIKGSEAAGVRRGQTFPLRRTAVFAGVLGLLYSLACLAGSSLEEHGYLAGPGLPEIGKGLGLWLLSGLIVFALWRWMDRVRERAADPSTERGHYRRNSFSGCLVIWAVLCLIDLVSLLAVYPGFFVYDAAEELAMVQSRTFTTHHPLLHVLLMGGVILAVHKITSSWNAGIFVYILLQMLAINAAFTYVLADLGGWANWHPASAAAESGTDGGSCKKLRLVSFLWLAFCPTVTMFVLCSCKDGLFAASLLIMTVELRHLLTDPFPVRRHVVWFLIAASLMMLFRNNGVYAYVVFFVIALAAVLFRGILLFAVHRHAQEHPCYGRRWGRFLVICVMPVVIYFIISKGLAAAVQATSNESQEILTVPIMQLGRTWQSDRDSFTAEEKKLMAELMAPADSPETESGEAIGWDSYSPVLSDQLKLHFRSDIYRSHKREFWDMYCHQLKAHPMTYLNAWLMTSYGFWYPEAVIDCYQGNTVYTFTYGDSSYFGYETEQPGERHSLVPLLDRWYRFLSLDVRAQKIPVLHLFLAPGMMAWLFAFLLFDLWRRKEKRLLLVYLPTFLVWLTVLLGPCTLPRYVVYLWFEFPLMLGELCPAAGVWI